MMYSVSYVCTKMHHFKAKNPPPKNFPNPACGPFGHARGFLPLVCPHPYWTPPPKWNSWLRPGAWA